MFKACVCYAAAFHEVPTGTTATEWEEWFAKFNQAILEEGLDAATRTQAMKQANPKYIMRNWMMTVSRRRICDANDCVVNSWGVWWLL